MLYSLSMDIVSFRFCSFFAIPFHGPFNLTVWATMHIDYAKQMYSKKKMPKLTTKYYEWMINDEIASFNINWIENSK